MMKAILDVLLSILILTAQWTFAEASDKAAANIQTPISFQALKDQLRAGYGKKTPTQWGEKVRGVKTRLKTERRILALTFDACGGLRGNGYDSTLMEYLIREKIPATLFVSGLWIDANGETFQQLANQPLFEIENHGYEHKPCSVAGRHAYGIRGTSSVEEVVDEVERNGRKIEALTGRRPKYYRSGTAHCDDVCAEIARALGYDVVNFSVRGDGGATYSEEEVKKALLEAPAGSILILHMNHPEAGTAGGVMKAIPELKRRGFGFVHLSAYELAE